MLQQVETTDPTISERLGLPAHAPLFLLERVRYAGDDPLAIDRAWLPMSVAGALLESDFGHTALYDELERLTGTRPQSGWERIAPLLPTPAERQLLAMRRGEAAFYIERLSSVDDQPVEWRTTIVRGDRYRFVAEFRAGAAPGLVATRP